MDGNAQNRVLEFSEAAGQPYLRGLARLFRKEAAATQALPAAWCNRFGFSLFSFCFKAGFEKGITEIGGMAHGRCKFFDLPVANKNQLAEQALHSIGALYEVERQARDMSDEDRWRIRQEKAAPIIETLHAWMLAQRDLVPYISATAKVLNYNLGAG